MLVLSEENFKTIGDVKTYGECAGLLSYIYKKKYNISVEIEIIDGSRLTFSPRKNEYFVILFTKSNLAQEKTYHPYSSPGTASHCCFQKADYMGSNKVPPPDDKRDKKFENMESHKEPPCDMHNEISEKVKKQEEPSSDICNTKHTSEYGQNNLTTNNTLETKIYDSPSSQGTAQTENSKLFNTRIYSFDDDSEKNKDSYDFILTKRLFKIPENADETFTIWLGERTMLQDETKAKLKMHVSPDSFTISPLCNLYDNKTGQRFVNFSKNFKSDTYDKTVLITNKQEAYNKITSDFYYEFLFNPFSEYNYKALNYFCSLDIGNHQVYNNNKDYFLIGRHMQNDIYDEGLGRINQDLDTSRAHAIFNKNNSYLTNISFNAPLFVLNRISSPQKSKIIKPVSTKNLCRKCQEMLKAITASKENSLQSKKKAIQNFLDNNCSYCNWDSYRVQLQSGDIVIIGNYYLTYRSYI